MKGNLNTMGELKIIEQLRKVVTPCEKNLLGMEDDSAIYDMGLRKHLVVNTDRVPISFGIRYGIVSYYGFGKYFAGAVLNDIIAKGGKPFGLLVALGCPNETQLTDLLSFYDGITDIIRNYDVYIIGGDTKQGTIFDVVGTALGFVDKDYFISRKGALEGDVVAVTGPLGLFGANMYTAVTKMQISEELKKELRTAYNSNLRIPYDEMTAVTALKAANSSLDISDGLLGDLNRITKLSAVGIEIDYSNIPFHESVLKLSRMANVDPLTFARIGGDLQIALTIKREKWAELEKRIYTENLKIFQIGRVTGGNGITMIRDGICTKIRKVPEWEWFKGVTMEKILLD